MDADEKLAVLNARALSDFGDRNTDNGRPLQDRLLFYTGGEIAMFLQYGIEEIAKTLRSFALDHLGSTLPCSTT